MRGRRKPDLVPDLWRPADSGQIDTEVEGFGFEQASSRAFSESIVLTGFRSQALVIQMDGGGGATSHLLTGRRQQGFRTPFTFPALKTIPSFLSLPWRHAV